MTVCKSKDSGWLHWREKQRPNSYVIFLWNWKIKNAVQAGELLSFKSIAPLNLRNFDKDKLFKFGDDCDSLLLTTFPSTEDILEQSLGVVELTVGAFITY